MWNAIEARIETVTEHQKSNLRGQLNQMVCSEKANVCKHLDEMESVYQQLCTRGTKISDEDYADALIHSLPQSYSTIMQSFLTICKKMKTPVIPAEIKDTARNEYDTHQSAINLQGKKPSEIALQADTRPGNRGRGHRRGCGGNRGSGENQRGGEERDQSRITCFNCGKKGHKAIACQAPKKEHENRDNRETAAVARNKPEEAWMAIFLGMGEVEVDGADGIDAEEIPLPDEHGDVAEEDMDEETNLPVDDMGMDLLVDDSETNLLDEPEMFTRQTIALIANKPGSAHLEAIEVYDSRCTKHMTSYRHCLSNFQSIPLKIIGAASQGTFSAVGTGDMIIRTHWGQTPIYLAGTLRVF